LPFAQKSDTQIPPPNFKLSSPYTYIIDLLQKHYLLNINYSVIKMCSLKQNKYFHWVMLHFRDEVTEECSKSRTW